MTLKCLQRLILGVLAVAALDTARAGVIFNLTPPGLSTPPGTTVEFTGILTNTGAGDVFLNADLSVLLYPTLTLDDSPFFANAPLSLAAGGGSYSGPFFDVIVSSAALPGLYSGSFSIEGGADSSAFGNLVTQDFKVTVISAVPEPTSLLLVATALVVISLTRSRIIRRRNSWLKSPLPTSIIDGPPGLPSASQKVSIHKIQTYIR